jgi:hypothetical protein
VGHADLREVRPFLFENREVGHSGHREFRHAGHGVEAVVSSNCELVSNDGNDRRPGGDFTARRFIKQSMFPDVEIGHLAALEGMGVAEQPDEILGCLDAPDHDGILAQRGNDAPQEFRPSGDRRRSSPP